MSEQLQLSKETTRAVAILVREGYDLSRLGIPGAPVRLASAKDVFQAIELGVIDAEEARPVLGFPRRIGALERVYLVVGAALQVVVSAVTFTLRTAPRHG